MHSITTGHNTSIPHAGISMGVTADFDDRQDFTDIKALVQQGICHQFNRTFCGECDIGLHWVRAHAA